MKDLTTCPACGSGTLLPCADLGSVPASSTVTWEAPPPKVATGQIRLVHCAHCAHVVNAAFDPTVRAHEGHFDNSNSNSNSLLASPSYRGHVASVAERILDRGIPDRTLELGCGEGELLQLLPGYRTGWGQVPLPVDGEKLKLRHGLWSPAIDRERYDLVVARHVLEHVRDPLALLTSLRSMCVGRGYFEVPDAGYDLGIAGWDVMYSHASYFHAGSLAAMCERAGFTVLETGLTFHNQYLYIEVEAGPDAPDNSTMAQPSGSVLSMTSHRHHAVVRSFGERFSHLVAHWRRVVAAHQRPVLWGAGARGVTFLSAVDPDRKMSVVDLSKSKHGRFLPTGHRVDSPDRLGTDIDAVITTNPAYRDEVIRDVAALGINAPVLTA